MDEECPKCGFVGDVNDVACYKITGSGKGGLPIVESVPVHIPGGIDCLKLQLADAKAQIASLTAGLSASMELSLMRRDEIDRLRGQLEAIRRKWVDGIGQLDRPWRVEMAGLVGDVSGLQEAADGPDARIRELARKTLEATKEHSDG